MKVLYNKIKSFGKGLVQHPRTLLKIPKAKQRHNDSHYFTLWIILYLENCILPSISVFSIYGPLAQFNFLLIQCDSTLGI